MKKNKKELVRITTYILSLCSMAGRMAYELNLEDEEFWLRYQDLLNEKSVERIRK